MSFKQEWKKHFAVTRRRYLFAASLFFLIVVLIILPFFLQFVENREGFSFEDPMLVLFDPLDVTWATFAIIYGALMLAVLYFIRRPNLLQKAVLTYAILASSRMIAMYLLPLNPPLTMIPLEDPFVQFFGPGEVLTKDLFFSGHTSTLFMLYLIAEKKLLKSVFLISTLLVGTFVILQHVHYSIDVFAAPFFVIAAYKIADLPLITR
ncbi:MAG: phosphatase PAP2 family protein [Melioribacteraceae bacterium]|nr:phosphatase PAP2 family protein [Melioribacteraceae bacterium]